MNMIEKVARALFAKNRVYYGCGWDEVYHTTREEHEMLARAAIEAMRDPTGDMIYAASDKPSKKGVIKDMFTAMIDEVLK